AVSREYRGKIPGRKEYFARSAVKSLRMKRRSFSSTLEVISGRALIFQNEKPNRSCRWQRFHWAIACALAFIEGLRSRCPDSRAVAPSRRNSSRSLGRAQAQPVGGGS